MCELFQLEIFDLNGFESHEAPIRQIEPTQVAEIDSQPLRQHHPPMKAVGADQQVIVVVDEGQAVECCKVRSGGRSAS